MSHELEIEFKNMLTESEFKQLCRLFDLNESSFFKQINDYFDTPTFGLRNKKSALRIRHLNGQHDFTLKQPYNGNTLETHQALSKEESDKLIQLGIMPAGTIEQAISGSGVNVDQLVHIGELMTLRSEFPYQKGTLFLDHSYYLNHEDFELEYEAEDDAEGRQIFSKLLKKASIPLRPSKNKILRLYEAILEAKGKDQN
ncbi:CYTH domain-containing protein [Sporolactobacillus sp. Y61]|jgi:uncharacterized protein YjbK|uniref:CYTH domain-containing protein n=1 Tax=Sporolactobacillus sp. Y61 TaxID=3160863 RepID=A0AAU8IC42_9BACL|nr:CYTH domain-containing protein [Sporolactobacillus sp. THM19-2]RYL90271.1 CYTH domain-containing protein [Sporolactobacillus sp. THM19-2]